MIFSIIENNCLIISDIFCCRRGIHNLSLCRFSSFNWTVWWLSGWRKTFTSGFYNAVSKKKIYLCGKRVKFKILFPISAFGETFLLGCITNTIPTYFKSEIKFYSILKNSKLKKCNFYELNIKWTSFNNLLSIIAFHSQAVCLHFFHLKIKSVHFVQFDFLHIPFYKMI